MKTCDAHGCPLPGTVSNAVHRNPMRESAAPPCYCRYHAGAQFEDWGKVTVGVKANLPAIEALSVLESPASHGVAPVELYLGKRHPALESPSLPRREKDETVGAYVRRCSAAIIEAAREGRRIDALSAVALREGL